MKTIKFKYLLPCALLGMMLGVASCVNDLDTVPLDKDELVSDVVFGNEPLAYEQSLAKIYAGMAIGGNSGGDSDQDVVGIDGGSQASFLRVLWNMQDLPSLRGKALNEEAAREAAEIALRHAIPLEMNGYKIEMAKVMVRRFLGF